MSQQTPYTINCPQCGQEQEALLYDAINVSQSPELKEQFIKNTLNAVICQGCGFSFRVDKNLLYNDAANGLMIYWMPSELKDLEQTEAEFKSSVASLTEMLPPDLELPEVQLVLNRTELVERIFLHEAGLDVTAIEYVKYIIYSKNLGKLPPENKALLFNAQDSTDENLIFVVQDVASKQLESIIQFSREAYLGLQEVMDQEDGTSIRDRLFSSSYISARALMILEEV